MSRILLCFKANKLVFCGFLDADRKLGTSGSQEKDAATFETCPAFGRSHRSTFLLVEAYRVILIHDQCTTFLICSGVWDVPSPHAGVLASPYPLQNCQTPSQCLLLALCLQALPNHNLTSHPQRSAVRGTKAFL